ncbi:MAG: c-type cytochrome biogenesis protein CcmI [Pseudomonadota bacterium]|nr:c-type cytochrome biogenesis protein CcmI [Pseudomonadota bacterium]
MLLFWSGASVLCILAVSFIIWPLYARGQTNTRKRNNLNTDFFHIRLAELEDSLKQGEISTTEFRELGKELQLALVSDSSTDMSMSPSASRLPFFAAAIIVILSIFTYADFGLSIGSLNDLILSKELHRSSPHDTADIRVTLQKLERRLKETPDNHDIRFLLARSWQSLSEYDKAVREFQYLVERFPSDPVLAERLAGALFLLDLQTFTPRVRSSIKKALELAPNNIEMLELSAIDAFRQGDSSKASSLLQQALVNAGGPRADLIKQALSDLSDSNNDLYNGPKELPANYRSLKALVEVGREIEVDPSAAVYVYARPYEGSQIPLALERLTIAQLPALVTLTSDQVMMEGMSLNDFDLVQLVARISEKGIANASPEDFEVVSEGIDLREEHSVFRLTILNRRE